MSSSIEKADEVLVDAPNRRPSIVDSLPAACRLSFGHVTSNSVSVGLIEIPSAVANNVKSYNLWCSKENEEIFSKGPVCSFLRNQPKRILISSLQPGTKYTFRAVAYGDLGEVGCSEAMCSTKSVDTNRDSSNPPGPADLEKEKQIDGGNCSNAGVEQDCGGAEVSEFQAVGDMHPPPPVTHGRSLDLNLNVSVPDLNEDNDPVPDLNEDDEPVPDLNKDGDPVPDLNKDDDQVPDLNKDDGPPNGCSKDEANGCTLVGAVRARDDAVPHGINNGRANVSPTVEALDSNSALVDRPPLVAPVGIDENFESCVKTIRCLECDGLINSDFRMKFLTWFSVGSSLGERRIVSSFIEALGDDPGSLAAQLVDSFSDIISKRLKQ